MSSYEFDKEAQDEIDFWSSQCVCLIGLLLNIIELNKLQTSQEELDKALERAEDYLNEGNTNIRP